MDGSVVRFPVARHPYLREDDARSAAEWRLECEATDADRIADGAWHLVYRLDEIGHVDAADAVIDIMCAAEDRASEARQRLMWIEEEGDW